MYDYIEGKLVKKQPTEAVLDVNGQGYFIKISLSTSQDLPSVGEVALLKTYLHVREDALQLYGFSSEEEREIFIGLLSISGIGPKLAQTILSGLTPKKFISAIQNRDERTLYSISGVGKKTAQRLIIELQDKLKNLQYLQVDSEEISLETGEKSTLETEAIMALLSLGYTRPAAEKAVMRVRARDTILTAEEMIKKALQSV